MPYAKNPIIRPVFPGGLFNYTWAAGGGNTLTSPIINIMEKEKEIGYWTLFLVGTGIVDLSIDLYYFLKDGIYSPVAHIIEGYTNGQASKQTSFQPASGFESPLNTHEWWAYNQDGFKIVITRASDVEVIFTHGSVKAI
jgi:hypothetical protein